MDSFKTFYNEKKGKYILFFGFYIIFFIFVSVYLRSFKDNKPNEEPVKEDTVITTYNLSNLINNDYGYTIVITDNDEVINFAGTKSNIDYANYPNKYFLDIYNINQLLKRSKLVNSDGLILTYELPNKEINDILLSNQEDGNNEIKVHVSSDTSVKEIDFDLKSYFNKDNYSISINYSVGEENENSSS